MNVIIEEIKAGKKIKNYIIYKETLDKHERL